jgi:hypothetical protein
VYTTPSHGMGPTDLIGYEGEGYASSAINHTFIKYTFITLLTDLLYLRGTFCGEMNYKNFSNTFISPQNVTQAQKSANSVMKVNLIAILSLHSSQKQGWDNDTFGKDRMPDGHEEWDSPSPP